MTYDYNYFYKFKEQIDYVIAFQQNSCATALKIAQMVPMK